MSQIPSTATIQARRARVRYDRCPTCQRVDVDGLHVDRCAEKETYRQHALAAGRAAGVPDVTTSDLWAHLNSRTYNELTSTRVLQLVLDLGWRPVIGSDPKRLWPEDVEIEWAVVDDGRIIHIAGATCPADVVAGAHGHGTHGPVGVARRTVTRTPWEHLEGNPS